VNGHCRFPAPGTGEATPSASGAGGPANR
jgi:hypothetical protein